MHVFLNIYVYRSFVIFGFLLRFCAEALILKVNTAFLNVMIWYLKNQENILTVSK